jgi:cyclohexanecarboxylate-CoA ligase
MPDEYRRRGWWRDETFLDDLRKSVRLNQEKTAVAVRRMADDSTHTLDYAELKYLTDRCAGALIDLGVRPGDTVAVQLTDRWELAVLALACPRAGARICPLLPVYRRRELEIMLALTEARVFVTMPEHEDLAGRLAADLPSLEHVVASGFEERFFGTPWEERHEVDGRELGPDDPYLVLFTSGTTGEPKGVLHSQNTLYAAIRGEAAVFGLDESLVMATMSAYTHYTGWVQGMLMPLSLGGTMVFQDDHGGPAVLDLLDRQGVTFLYAAPHYLRGLIDAKRASSRELPALRWLVSGSAPIPPHYVEEVRREFGLRLFSLWGMSENGPVTISRPEDPEDWAARSDGSPISDMQIRIDPIPGQEVGTLWVRGPTQCLGYHRREELYAAHLDDDGWFDTGDLARPDGRGGIRIAGRAKDIILREAFIVPVTDIEDIIGQHPDVREVTVIGLPADEGADETICAVVAVREAGGPVTLDDVHRRLRDAGTTELYWPERLEIVDRLPTTPTGKVRKVELTERFTPNRAAR